MFRYFVRLIKSSCINFYIQKNAENSKFPAFLLYRQWTKSVDCCQLTVVDISHLRKMLIESDDCLDAFEEMIYSVVFVR